MNTHYARATPAPLNVLFWASHASPGERVCYHVKASDDDIGHFGSNALAAHNSGLVFLAQRRDGNTIRYEATRISDRTAMILGLGKYR